MRRHIALSVAALGFLVAAAAVPHAAVASCLPGTTPAYDDISDVAVAQYEFPVARWPIYTFTATYYPGVASRPEHADARLDAKRNVPKQGKFTAADPLRAFRTSVDILRSAGFFRMRLTPVSARYIDGPTDSIAVVACGIEWSLGNLQQGSEFDLQDDNGRRFQKLEDDLREAIFAFNWLPITPGA
jgi:hypothetical protein